MKKLHKKVFLAPVLLFFTPLIAWALDIIPLPNGAAVTTATLVANLFGFFWPFIVGAGIAAFIGIGFIFLTSRGDASKATQGAQAVALGIVGVAVILLAFSIFSITATFFG